MQNEPTLEEKLDKCKWEKRVLLVISSSQTSEQFAVQKTNLEAQEAGMAERDLKIIYLPLDKMKIADKLFLEHKYLLKNTEFCVILIGKDGGEKRRSTLGIAPKDLFQIIDAMPMRQQEMKNRNK